MTFRVTDHFNGPNRDEAATIIDLPQPFYLHCAGNDDPTIGSTCRFGDCPGWRGPRHRVHRGGQHAVHDPGRLPAVAGSGCK